MANAAIDGCLSHVALIEKSGMVYSQEWTEGIIRNERIAAPKELILLCLVSSRFAKQGDQLLSGLTRDFGVSSIIAEGLHKLKLDKKYPKVRRLSRAMDFFPITPTSNYYPDHGGSKELSVCKT